MGIEALNANIYSDSFADSIELNDIGFLFAMTGNTDINKYAIDRFGKQFGENGAYRLSSSEEALSDKPTDPNHLFSGGTDFLRLSEGRAQVPQYTRDRAQGRRAFKHFAAHRPEGSGHSSVVHEIQSG